MSTFDNSDHEYAPPLPLPPSVKGRLHVNDAHGQRASVEVIIGQESGDWYATGAVHRGAQHIARTFYAPSSKEAWASFVSWVDEVLS